MKPELEIVTEIGTFGDLNIDDPTVKKLTENADEEELDMNELAKKILNS